MAELEVWKDYVTVINAARMNAIRDHIITNEGNISYHQTLINANTTDICNLSNIKLSRDGSQPMTGELQCNSGVKTDTIDTMTEAMLTCQKPLQIDSRLYGNSSVGLWLYSDFDIYAPSIRLYSYNSSLPGKILISTPGDDSPASTRIEIPGKADFVDIKFRKSNVLPYDDNYQDLGNSSYRWKTIYGAAIRTNMISTVSGDTLKCENYLEINKYLFGKPLNGLWLFADYLAWSPRIELDAYDAGGGIRIKTCGGGISLVPRIDIPGNTDFVDIKFAESNLLPYYDNYQNLGNSSYKWKKIYAVEGHFDLVTASRTMPFYLENPSSGDKYLLGAGTVSTMYQFNTTVTLTGYKLMILTSNSSGYIKVSIDDANGWTYEKTYSLGSAGGYRYNESFNHVIETTNGIQLKISNCSNISSTTIVLEYK